MLLFFSVFLFLHRNSPVHANWLGTLCPDGKNTYYANLRGWQFDYNEFPIDTKYDSWTPLLDPCVTLISSFNDKYRYIGLLSAGQFGQTVCQRQCERAMNLVTPSCGPRRMPPMWQTAQYDPSALVSKLNCSDWNLPLNDTELNEPIHLFYAPTTINETDETYSFMQTIAIEKITLSLAPIDSPTDVNYVNAMLLKYQEIGLRINYIHLQGTAGSSVALNGLEGTLSQMPDVHGLLLNNFNISALGPFLQNMANLNYFELSSVPISSFPSWLANTPNLMYLKIENPSPDLLELSNLDALPNLEYFILRTSMIDHLPDTILQQSVGLRFLDLSCNELTSLPEHVFDHFTQLQGLILGGNQITTLGLQTLASLTQLKVLDLKQPNAPSTDYYSSNSDISSFSEMDNSASKKCNSNTPSGGFQGLQNAHFVNNKQLQRIELANNVDLEMPEDLFVGLENTLRVLDLYGMGLTNLNGFHLERLCEMRNMRVSNNDFGIDPDWLTYQTVINLQKMNRFYISSANISLASAPLFVLSRADETLQAFLIADAGGQPFAQNTCEMAIWGSLLRNQPWSMPTDNGECAARFTAIQVEAKGWYNLRKNLAYAPCFATIISGAHQHCAMSSFVIAALVLFVKLL